MARTLIIILVAMNMVVGATAQTGRAAWFSDIMHHAIIDSHRREAADSLNPIVKKVLRNTPLNEEVVIPFISILKAKDLRVVTWQYNSGDYQFSTSGFIQTIDTLIDLEPLKQIASKSRTYTTEDWPSTRYYRLEHFSCKGDTFYLLFGQKAIDEHVNRITIDVLQIHEGAILFGAPFLVDEEGEKAHRIMFDHLASAQATATFDEIDRMIVYEQMSKVTLPDLGPVNVPNGKLYFLTWDGESWAE